MELIFLLASNPYKSNGSNRRRWVQLVTMVRTPCSVQACLFSNLVGHRCKASTVSPRRKPVLSWLRKKAQASTTNENPTQVWPMIDFLRCYSDSKTTSQTWMAGLPPRFHQCRTKQLTKAGSVPLIIVTSWCSLTYSMLQRHLLSVRFITWLTQLHNNRSSKTSYSTTLTRIHRIYLP